MTNFETHFEVLHMEDFLISVALQAAERILAESGNTLPTKEAAALAVKECNENNITRLFTAVEHFVWAKLHNKYTEVKGA